MTSKNILLAILFIVVFCAGLMLGRLTAPMGTVLQTPLSGSQTNSQTDSDTDTAQTPEANTTNVAAEMTDAQRNMLKSFGLDPDTITITPSMVACAEAKVGAARVEEIRNGATPSIMEGASLLGCYSQ